MTSTLTVIIVLMVYRGTWKYNGYSLNELCTRGQNYQFPIFVYVSNKWIGEPRLTNSFKLVTKFYYSRLNRFSNPDMHAFDHHIHFIIPFGALCPCGDDNYVLLLQGSLNEIWDGCCARGFIRSVFDIYSEMNRYLYIYMLSWYW